MAGAGFHTAKSHDDAWHWLTTEADFDIAMLQESIPPQRVLEEFPVLVHNPKYSHAGKRWGNSIICREDTHVQYVFNDHQPFLQRIGGAVTVAQPINPDGVWLINIHSNATSLPPELFLELKDFNVPHCHPKKIWEIEVATHFMQPILEGKQFVFGGDLNSGYLFDSVNRYDNNKILFENMRQQGYNDLRLAHSDDEQQTYFKKNNGPYQLDHLFGDANTVNRTSHWEVLSHVARDLELSDHAPIIVEIEVDRRHSNYVSPISNSYML